MSRKGKNGFNGELSSNVQGLTSNIKTVIARSNEVIAGSDTVSCLAAQEPERLPQAKQAKDVKKTCDSSGRMA